MVADSPSLFQRLRQRMGVVEPTGRRSKLAVTDGTKGVVEPVALGSGLSLAELAAEEEADSGLRAPMLLSAVSPAGASDAAAESDGEGAAESEPEVKYDYWGRPMA